MSWRRNATIYKSLFLVIRTIQHTTTGLKTVPWFKQETLCHTSALSRPWGQLLLLVSCFVYCSHGGLRLRVRESKIDNRIVFITFPMGCNQENISSQDSTGPGLKTDGFKDTQASQRQWDRWVFFPQRSQLCKHDPVTSEERTLNGKLWIVHNVERHYL